LFFADPTYIFLLELKPHDKAHNTNLKFISYSDKCNIYEIEGNKTIITYNTLGNERNCEESWPIRIILSYSLVIFRFLHIAIYQQDINQCLEILETPVLEKAINVKNRSKEVSFGKF